MEATVSLNGILSFIYSLSLGASNKQWLGERLIEEAHKEADAKKADYDNFINSVAVHGQITFARQKKSAMTCARRDSSERQDA